MCNAFCCITVIFTQIWSLTAHISREKQFCLVCLFLKMVLKYHSEVLSCDLIKLILEERDVSCCNGTFPEQMLDFAALAGGAA